MSIKSKSISIDQKIRIKDLDKKVKFYRMPKVYTVKEWKKMEMIKTRLVGDKEYHLDVREVICKRYDVVLINHKTKKEALIGILKGFNFENFDKGMDIFDDAMKEFDKAMKDFGKELGGDKPNQRKITGKKRNENDRLIIWGNPSVPKIWGDSKPKKKSRKKKSKKSTQDPMEKIWGKNKVTLL